MIYCLLRNEWRACSLNKNVKDAVASFSNHPGCESLPRSLNDLRGSLKGALCSFEQEAKKSSSTDFFLCLNKLNKQTLIIFMTE